MGRGKQLSIMQRGQIVVLLSEGLSQRYIANKLGVSQCAVAYTAKKQVQTGQVVDRKRSGRPRVSSIRTDNLIHRYSLANPSISSSEIHSELNNSGLDPPSSRTIRRRLCNTFGLRARKPARKPYLTAVQRKKRIDFCKIHQNWTADMWRSVEFSDETAVSQFKTYRPFVRRPPGTRLSPKYLLPMVKHPQTTMIWGASHMLEQAPYILSQRTPQSQAPHTNPSLPSYCPRPYRPPAVPSFSMTERRHTDPKPCRSGSLPTTFNNSHGRGTPLI